MKKLLLIAGIALLIFFSGCTKNNEPVACTMEAKMCEDGSFAGRTGPNCEFEKCPELKFCDATNPCLEGNTCYKFEGNEKPYCFPANEDPCSKCASGKCNQLESYPVQIRCQN